MNNFLQSLRNVALVAVTKGQSIERINNVIASGIKIIGENYMQEAEKKIPFLLPVEKHFIGHLQTNKVRKACALFDCIQSIDAEELWGRINERNDKEKKISVFLQINGGKEETKYGFLQEEMVSVVKKWQAYPKTMLCGIMVVAPEQEAEKNRLIFRAAKKEFDHARKICPTISHLSMGTSQDYLVAMDEGTTLVRLGTKIFGSRDACLL